MGFTEVNYKTLSELRKAMRNDETIRIKKSEIEPRVNNGIVYVEGPWPPEEQTWDTMLIIENGVAVGEYVPHTKAKSKK